MTVYGIFSNISTPTYNSELNFSSLTQVELSFRVARKNHFIDFRNHLKDGSLHDVIYGKS